MLEKAGIPGDVDGNGQVQLKDAILLQMYINRLNVTLDLSVADVDADGKIQLKDVILIQQYVNHLTVELK